MYDLSPKTLFIGKKIIYLPSCHSTNDIAAELVHSNAISEGAVVITDDQTSGRGQRGTQWVTARGLNFTFSLVLMPSFMTASEQFLISQTIALGVRNYVSRFTNNASVKWPNDLYVNNLKIGGILIENSLQGRRIAHSIIGIGLNINQSEFQSGRATSLRLETGQVFDLSQQLPLLLQSLEQVYLRLRGGQFDVLRREYLASLVGFGTSRLYKSRDGIFEGTIMGVSPIGKLQIQIGNGLVADYDLKEIEWLWED